ncbi:MAG: hypothetical protein WC841_02505 [Candidatus Shapirobacteria bacterium]|jgi:hypothetical protein
MSADLNLLPSQAKFQAARIKVKSQVSRVMILISVLWVLGLVVVFLFWFLAKMALVADEKKYKKAVTDFQGISDAVLNSEQLKYRAKIVGEILNKRFEYGKAFQTVTTLFPSVINLDKYELKSQKIFSVSGVVPDWKEVDTLEEIVRDVNDGLSEGFMSAKLNSLVYSTEKGWTFDMEVKIK